MELAEALETVIARTRHERFRDLTDPQHPSYHPRYVALVIAMATGAALTPEIPPPRPAAELAPVAIPSPPGNPHMERLHLVHSCDYRGEPFGCGCNATNHCGLARGKLRSSPHEVSLRDCLECVSGR